MSETIVGRVTPAPSTDSEPSENVFASAIAQERRNCARITEERDALRGLLAVVYSYCARDIEAMGGRELLREVQTAIGAKVQSDL